MMYAFILIGIAVLLFSLLYPTYAIFLPLVIHPLYVIRGTIGVIPTTLLEVVLISVIIGVGVQYVGRLLVSPRAIRIFCARHQVCIFIGIFLLAATVSAIIASHQETAWGVWKAMVFEPILYASLLMYVMKVEQLDKRLLVSFFAGGICAAVTSLGFGLFGAAWELPLMRLSGIYDVPNSLAMIMAPMLAASLILLVKRRSVLLVALTVLFSLGLLASQSLAGIITVAAVFGFFTWMRQKNKAALIVAAVLVLGIGIQIVSGKLSISTLQEDSSLLARAQIWQVSVELIRDNTLLGTGLGTFEPAYQDELRGVLDECPDKTLCLIPRVSHPTPPLEWVVRDPHNIVLSFWLNTGIIGMVSMGILIATACTQYIRRIRNFASDYGVMDVLGAALLVLLLFGVVDVPYWKNDLAILWWVLLLGAIFQFRLFHHNKVGVNCVQNNPSDQC